MSFEEPDWEITPSLTNYEQAVARMEQRVEAIFNGEEKELIWLLEHPPIYTAGVSAKPHDLLNSTQFPVYKTGRGGQYTYHGPGQRVVYVMLDLRQRGQDVRRFVAALEDWTLAALADLEIQAQRQPGLIGLWVAASQNHNNEANTSLNTAQERYNKIAAVGIRLKKWVSFHGIAINVSPNLSHFEGIVPCGISDQGVTSLEKLSKKLDKGFMTDKPLMTQLDDALWAHRKIALL